VAAGAIAAVAFLARPKSADTPPVPMPSASAAASARVRALTEWPPPKTSSAEAATLYAEGLQALRDASIVQFRNDLLRAVALDPHLASAQLRLASNSWVREDALEHLAAANQARASLDDREARLLSFVDVTRRGDVEKGFAAARELARDLPDDPEALWWAGVELKWSDQHDAARAMFERAVQLDPKFAGAEFGIAEIATLWGDQDAQLAASERCLAIAPRAATCLEMEADVHDARGECGEVEQEARDVVAIDPTGWGGYDTLLSALAAEGAPSEALADLAAKEAATVAEPAKARWVADANAANVALLRGDLSAAEASLLALQRDESGRAGDDAHRAEGELIALYEEEGDKGKAADVAAVYLQKLPGWTHAISGPARSRAVWALRRSGRLSASEAKARREQWAADASKHGSWWQVKQFWFRLYASGVETEAEAREALAAVPAFSPLPALGTAPGLQGELAVVHALTGDAGGAIPGLRTATAACSSWVNMRYWSGYHSGDSALFDAMGERLLLGQLLEKKGDAAGACAQYGAILSRWGHAKPRSVTADKARERSKAIGCH
jgi:eukaryotic-like serine/threonine-protein kinase